MKDNIERLLKNYLNTRKSWESWCYLVSSGGLDFNTGQYDYDSSIKKIVDENILLSHLRYLAFKDFHIEIYKIIRNSLNTTDNIFSVLNIFLIERPDLKYEIQACLKTFGELQLEIKKMTDIRDKLYAHLDPNYKDYIEMKSGLKEYNETLKAIEAAIILLISNDRFQKALAEIPSRDEFNLPDGKA